MGDELGTAAGHRRGDDRPAGVGRDADELQQRIELEAVSFATAFISLVYLTGGFLQSGKVIDVRSNGAVVWGFPLVCLSYGLAKGVVARRYH